jgi:mannose-6-phosphate isomerase-like protein (cupin superfamily)
MKKATIHISEPSSELGPRLRAIRLLNGVGLRELARRVDLSPSSISQIETGKMRPSVSTLYALANEFGVTVDALLFEGEPLVRADAAPSVPGTSRLVTEPGLSVQRAGERPTIPLNSGVKWERLMVWADEDVEFLEAIYEPGGSSSPGESFVRHHGHEFGTVLSGTLRVVVGFDEFILTPGDSITFPSSTPHRLSNEGTETVRAIWVVRGRRGIEPTQQMQEPVTSRPTVPPPKRTRRSPKQQEVSVTVKSSHGT